MDEIFEDIAKDYMAVETLSIRGRDHLDFSEVSIISLREGLEAAYRRGLEEQAAVLGPEKIYGYRLNAVIRGLSVNQGMSTATIAAAMQSFGLQYEGADLRQIASRNGFRAQLTGEQYFTLCARAELYLRVK